MLYEVITGRIRLAVLLPLPPDGATMSCLREQRRGGGEGVPGAGRRGETHAFPFSTPRVGVPGAHPRCGRGRNFLDGQEEVV